MNTTLRGQLRLIVSFNNAMSVEPIEIYREKGIQELLNYCMGYDNNEPFPAHPTTAMYVTRNNLSDWLITDKYVLKLSHGEHAAHCQLWEYRGKLEQMHQAEPKMV